MGLVVYCQGERGRLAVTDAGSDVDRQDASD